MGFTERNKERYLSILILMFIWIALMQFAVLSIALVFHFGAQDINSTVLLSIIALLIIVALIMPLYLMFARAIFDDYIRRLATSTKKT